MRMIPHSKLAYTDALSPSRVKRIRRSMTGYQLDMATHAYGLKDMRAIMIARRIRRCWVELIASIRAFVGVKIDIIYPQSQKLILQRFQNADIDILDLRRLHICFLDHSGMR